MQLALAIDLGSACGVFPGQREVGHAVPSVSAYNFTVCDDKAQLHRDKQADFSVALIYVANSVYTGLCRYTICSKLQQTHADLFIKSFTYLQINPSFKVSNVSQSFKIAADFKELNFIEFCGFSQKYNSERNTK